MRIIFMGTPDFAVRTLEVLVENSKNSGIEVVGVITATDKPAGRGNKLQQSAVKKYALSKGLRVLQPPRLKNKAFLAELKSLNADLQVVVAFRMLPALVFEMPPLGTINLHASLLPQYRGAAPINWAVINGETQTGVTTFFIEQEIDTGKMIFQDTVEITPEMTAGELHDALMEKGGHLVLKTVKAIKSGDYPKIDQPTVSNANELKAAPKIFKETCKIDWNQSTEVIHNFVRGLSPYPCAFTKLEGKRFKIYKASPNDCQHNVPVGSILTDNQSYLYVATQDGLLNIETLQMEGKRKMEIEELLNGYNFFETK